MKTLKSYILALLGILMFTSAFTACSDDDAAGQLLKNDCLKRTLGPNVVGREIYFVYAMAQPYGSGRIVSASVEASIAGAEGTTLEHNSYHTDDAGTDIPVPVGNPCQNEANRTTVTFAVDTCAAALRYHYIVPEEARGKEVSFVFTAKNNLGETVQYKMGPYAISKCDVQRDLTLSKSKCYISIEDMAVYNLADAEAIPDKIDLVYLWRNMTDPLDGGVNFGHTFAAPCADREWLSDLNVPATMTRNTRIRREYGIIDGHLTDEPNYGTYIDDVDFETIELDDMPNYCVNMKAEGGMWVQMADGKYRAYVFINYLKSVSGGTISIKRYKMHD